MLWLPLSRSSARHQYRRHNRPLPMFRRFLTVFMLQMTGKFITCEPDAGIPFPLAAPPLFLPVPSTCGTARPMSCLPYLPIPLLAFHNGTSLSCMM